MFFPCCYCLQWLQVDLAFCRHLISVTRSNLCVLWTQFVHSYGQVKLSVKVAPKICKESYDWVLKEFSKRTKVCILSWKSNQSPHPAFYVLLQHTFHLGMFTLTWWDLIVTYDSDTRFSSGQKHTRANPCKFCWKGQNQDCGHWSSLEKYTATSIILCELVVIGQVPSCI